MATYYVATTGNDANNGTSPATAWLTFSKANTAASSGDTVYIGAGTYTFSSMTLSKQITWIGAVPTISGMPTTILDGAAAHVRWSLGVSTNQTQTFNNLMFQNVVQTSNIAVFTTDNSTNTNTFNDCVFTNLGVCSGHGGSGFGVISGAQSFANTYNLNNCLFYNIYTSGSSTTNAPIFDSDKVVWNLTNTTIYNSATGGSALQGIFRRNSTPYTVNMKNCIAYSTTSLPFGGYITTTLQYSTFYNISSVPAGTELSTADPLFIDPSTSKFGLQPTSPILIGGNLV